VFENFSLKETKKHYPSSPLCKFNGRSLTQNTSKGNRSKVRNVDEPNLPNEDFARDNICPELLITEQEVKDQLEILNNTKPSDPDGVAPRILRSVSQCLVSPFSWCSKIFL
jgi:hypothetical protein